ncbi:MAG TPA: hypothetical protein VGM94_10235 [Galbitalea sp.]|jgi:hypothetical protein
MSRGRRIALAIAIPLVVLVAAGVSASAITLSASTNAIIVTTDAKPFSCANQGDVTTLRSQGRYIAGVNLNKDLDCDLHIRIHNDGDIPVEIDSIRFPSMGYYGRYAYFDIIAGQPSRGAEDAVGIPTDPIEIDGGGAYILHVHVRLDKCARNSPGGAGSWDNEPALGVRILGVREEVKPTDVHLAFVATKYQSPKSCDSSDVPNSRYDSQ